MPLPLAFSSFFFCYFQIIRALYDYTPDPSEAGPNELPFNKGDFFYVTARENDSDWYEVCNPATDAKASVAGLVPVSFFETVRGGRDSHEDDNSIIAGPGASAVTAASGSASASGNGNGNANGNTLKNEREQHLSVASNHSKSSSVESSGSSRYNYNHQNGTAYEGAGNLVCNTTGLAQPHVDLRSPTFSIPEDDDTFTLDSVAKRAPFSHPTSQAQSRSHSTSHSRTASPTTNENSNSKPNGAAAAGLGINVALTSSQYNSGYGDPPVLPKPTYPSTVSPISNSNSTFSRACSPPPPGTFNGYPTPPIDRTSPLHTKTRSNTVTASATGTMSPMTSSASTHSGGSSGKGAMVYAVVLYDFKAERPDELDAKEGDAIIVIARSTPDWVVAKPIGKLGGPGLVPVSFLEIRDMVTGQPAADNLDAIVRAGVPRVEEWKKQTAEYKNSSITLGKLDASGSGHHPAGSTGMPLANSKATMPMAGNSHASMSSMRSGHSGHSARTRESARSGRSFGSGGHGHLVDQMGRLAVHEDEVSLFYFQFCFQLPDCFANVNF